MTRAELNKEIWPCIEKKASIGNELTQVYYVGLSKYVYLM